MAIETAKVIVMAITEMREEERRAITGTGQPKTAEGMKPRVGRPSLMQPVFSLNANDKYVELKQYEIDLINIFLTRHYELNGI